MDINYRMINANPLTRIDLRVTLAVAIFGLFMVAFPIFFFVSSDFINAVSVFAPFVGGVAWVWTIVRKFGRGVLSNFALMLVSPASYFVMFLATIVLSMKTI